MARINIEDALFFDMRFRGLVRLLGSEKLAIGEIIIFWRLAQEQFKHGRLISEEMFSLNDCSEHLITCDLAEKTDDGIRAKGDLKHFGWLIERQNAGRLGGSVHSTAKAQAAKIREQNKRNQSTKLNDYAGKPQASTSKHKPPTPTQSPTPTPKNNTYAHSNENAPLKVVPKIAQGELERVYVLYPRKIGKSVGMSRLKGSVKTKEDLELLEKAVNNYATYCSTQQIEPRFVKHFSTFASTWRDWVEQVIETNHGFKKTDIGALLEDCK